MVVVEGMVKANSIRFNSDSDGNTWVEELVEGSSDWVVIWKGVINRKFLVTEQTFGDHLALERRGVHVTGLVQQLRDLESAFS